MATNNSCSGDCPIQKEIGTIGNKWGILTIMIIGNNGSIRYSHIMERLVKVSRKSLAETLKRLERSGMVKKRTYEEFPPHTEYVLTDDGIELYDALVPLIIWIASRAGDTDCTVLRRTMARAMMSNG